VGKGIVYGERHTQFLANRIGIYSHALLRSDHDGSWLTMRRGRTHRDRGRPSQERLLQDRGFVGLDTIIIVADML